MKNKVCVFFAVFLFLTCLLGTPSGGATEPYFITIQKLELKKTDGQWVDILEPDHRVDLLSTEATISFFNNGRVPTAEYSNFRVTFEDHGCQRQISRKVDFELPVSVKKGSFVNVAFDLQIATNKDGTAVRPTGVRQLRLTSDGAERMDMSDQLELKG